MKRMLKNITIAVLTIATSVTMATAAVPVKPAQQQQAVNPAAPAAIAPAVANRPAAPNAPQTATTPQQIKLPYPGAGPGPVADITDWLPKSRIPQGTELTIQGRNLRPGQLNAYIGNTKLAATTQLPNEIRFRLPQGVILPPSPLVVYNQGGQIRVLDNQYVIYDPNVSISRVQPGSFSSGDTVTVYGTGLFDTWFTHNYLKHRMSGAPTSATISFESPGYFVKLGNYMMKIENPQISQRGDSLTFIAGDLYESEYLCINGGCGSRHTFIQPPANPPQSATGDLKIALKGSDREVFGSGVSWRAGGPRIDKMYGKIFYGINEPFVILPNDMSKLLSAGRVVVEGVNLDANYTFAGITIPSSSQIDNENRKIELNIPLNASNGKLCGTRNGITRCSERPLQVFGEPFISRVPTMPLALGVRHTIEGINLLPPSIPGLAYTFNLFGRSNRDLCNDTLTILEHTSTRIVFRVGDPNIQISDAQQRSCANGDAYSNHRDYTMYLFATYQGRNSNHFWSAPYYLRPWGVR